VQHEWARRPIRERARVLLRFHDLVLKHQDQVLDLIQLENGKARRQASSSYLRMLVAQSM
jgi:succinate-semialdehyde dehydrogenase / glutarate-semialdehyde dehydrogenase